MMPTATILILIVTGVATLIAFRRPDLKERWIFDPGGILLHRQYARMLTGGFIHADWTHFIFNAFSFFSFARNIELVYGAKTLLVVYFSSILGGSLLSLVIHRHHEYRALGASGGVCGIIFASIFLLPGNSIMLFPLPVGVPAYIYAVLFLVFSFVAHRRQRDNIGHDAHLGGAMVGLLAATAMYPALIFAAPWMFTTVIGLSAVILLILIYDPGHLLEHHLNITSHRAGGRRAREYDENRERNEKRSEIDRLLDKVAQKGMGGLSRSEKKKLDELSKEVYGRK